MKKLFIVLILSFVTIVSRGQTSFLPGYIIKNNGDSLIGLVYYSYSDKFEKNCRFKRFEIADEFDYGPEKISAYGFRSGRRFESKKAGNKYLFFEVLMKGPVSLYTTPSNHKILYVESERDGFVKLNEGTIIIRNTTYENYRYYLASLTKQPTNVIPNDYNSASIIQYLRGSGVPISVYNQTVDKSFLRDYSLTKNSPLWQLGIAGGYQLLLIDILGNKSPKYFDEAEFSYSYRPVFGIFISRRFSRFSDRLSAELSMLYVSDTYHGYAEYNSTYTYKDDILIEFSSIQVPLTLKLKFGKAESKVRPIIKAGVYGSSVLDYSYSRYTERFAENNVYTDVISDFKLYNEIGYYAATGIDIPLAYRNLGIELGFSHGSHNLKHTSNDWDTSVKSNCFQLMIKLSL